VSCVEKEYVSEMNVSCPISNAVYFTNKAKCFGYCSSRKVSSSLPDYPNQNDLLRYLLVSLYSPESLNDSRYFFVHIRSIRAAISFTSLGAIILP
jgi:hypothetical protein